MRAYLTSFHLCSKQSRVTLPHISSSLIRLDSIYRAVHHDISFRLHVLISSQCLEVCMILFHFSHGGYIVLAMSSSDISAAVRPQVAESHQPAKFTHQPTAIWKEQGYKTAKNCARSRCNEQHSRSPSTAFCQDRDATELAPPKPRHLKTHTPKKMHLIIPERGPKHCAAGILKGKVPWEKRCLVRFCKFPLWRSL
jgi:hypothetical protein